MPPSGDWREKGTWPAEGMLIVSTCKGLAALSTAAREAGMEEALLWSVSCSPGMPTQAPSRSLCSCSPGPSGGEMPGW